MAAKTSSTKTPSARQLENERITKIYAGVLCGFIAIFMVIRWAHFMLNKAQRSRSAPQNVFSPIIRPVRMIQKIVMRSCPGFPSLGHAVLVAMYIATNVVLSFVHLDYNKVNYFAARFGWMTVANFAFIVFLALKNTPLAFLTAYSYERLNYLHRVAGYTTILFMLLHTATYAEYEIAQGKGFKLIEVDNVAGIIAGCAMFLILLSAFFVMRWNYELFYVAHIALFVVAIATTGLHRPDWINRIPIVMIMMAAAWTIDRSIRLYRTLRNSINNEAHLSVLPNGGTRIVMKKPLRGASSGSHCFLWIPRVRLFESHPFTIVSNGPEGLELVARAHDGFTKTLHEFAMESTTKGISLLAAADGPYGTFPDPTTYDRVVIIVGGSGGTFAFGLALDFLKRQSSATTTVLDIVWAVKRPENVLWFSQHIETLRAYAPRVVITLHITEGLKPDYSERRSANKPQGAHEDILSLFEDDACQSQQIQALNVESPSAAEKDPTRESLPRRETASSWTVNYNKLKLESAIPAMIANTDQNERILVTVCGPSAMVKTSRNIVSGLVRPDMASLDLHCESFNW